MNRKIWKALGIVVCMLALAAPHAMAETNTHMVTADTDFAKVVKNINASGVDDENVIELCADITLTVNHTLKRSTTIKSKDEDRKISINGSNAGITVAGEGTVLNLGAKGYDKKLTIEGDGDARIQAAFVTVSEGATANMYENVTLQNRKSTGNACIVIMGSKSVFNMRGGVTENCSRAVIADSGATFHMFDGEIKDCEVYGDGVILVHDNSKFIMEGGTISGCTAVIGNGGGLCAENSSTITISGGTISGCEGVLGGGLYADNSTITINKGTISGCTAVDNGGGLYADNSTINISDGTISGCKGVWGGGLYAENSSTIEISGGTISGCTVGAGGGLFVDSSTVRISGGIISGCITSDTGNGGGLYANHSTIKITGGRIENNKAAHGGGVALIGKTTFEKPITNWTVIGNEAYATGGVGGGIKLENGSMDVSAGSNRIYNNTAGGQGADIFLLNDSSTIKLPNAANMNATYRDSGIEIDGWYKDDNPRYTPSENGVGVDVSGELTGGLPLVASYKIILVRIEIDVNGGVGGSGSQTVQKGKTVTLEAPTKEGHLFTGWKDEKGNSYPAGADGKVNITVTEDMTLTAEWKKLPSALVRIEIDANGGVGGSGSQTVEKGKTVTLEAPTKEGHLFTGWKDEKGNSYPAGADGKVNITVTEDMTLTAVWEARTFTVTYVLLDGKTRTETVAYGQKLTLGEEPRTGYTFVGWKDGEKMYHAGETITVTEDKTLTAVWDTRSFTVTYVLLNGKTRTETAAYGQNVTLGEEPRTGYTFVGWKDGEKMYHAGETITVTEDMTLTAEWEKLPSAENLPKTGDESPVLLWSAVLVVSAAAGFMLKRKK